MKKTNAMRILDKHKASYDIIEYDISDDLIDGVSVAHKIGEEASCVFKTLLLVGASKNHYVVMIAVNRSLNLKAVAKHFNEKKVEMIAVKDILKLTGYVRGGCSPLGMKKAYKTLLDDDAFDHDYIVFSGGKKGLQIKMLTKDFVEIIKCERKNVVA